MNKQQAASLSIFSNSALIIFKVLAGIYMGSISVLSEAIHSGIDLLASVIAFFSIKQAVKPEDDKHQFGHGKFENISGFVEALLIFIAAILIIVEAIKKLASGHYEVESVLAGIVVMLISSVINFFISMTLLKISKREHSIALEADAMHLLTDVYTSLGVFGGLIILKLTGIEILDPIVALLVALLIIKAAYELTMKSIKDLLDETLPEEELEKIIQIVNNDIRILGYHKLRTRKSGERREIDIHLQIDPENTIVQAHELCHGIENKIKEEFPASYIVVHCEPCKK